MKKLIQISILFFSISFYAQNDTISSIENHLTSKVSVKYRNVIFRGIRNQILINVPNPETLTASSPGLILENGNFFITPSLGVRQKLFLKFKSLDGNFISETHEFIVKNISHNLGFINGNNCLNCIVLLKKEELKKAKISIKIPDLPFLDDLEAGSFRITFYSEKLKERIQLVNEGNIFTIENYKILSELPVGTRLVINDISNKNRCEMCSEFISIIQIEIIE